MLTIAVVFGTRPDTIKLAPVIKALQGCPKEFRVVSIATAQHRHMLDQVLNVFGVEPDFDLDIMLPQQSLEQITARGVERLGEVFGKVKPDAVLVQGTRRRRFLGVSSHSTTVSPSDTWRPDCAPTTGSILSRRRSTGG